MATRVCPHCGRTHKASARFCPLTGKMLSGLVEQSRPQVSPPEQESITGRLPPNTFLHSRYMIVRKIGHGGMAAVYQATDTFKPGSAWAVKEMSDMALTSAQDREYAIQCFHQEADLLRTLNHPNLPKVVDNFTEGGKHYLVMEFIEGQSLLKLLGQRVQPFSEQEVTGWAKQLCDVLVYLHEQEPKIIFRDLKPSNIILTPQGQIKLIDFGIARFFKPWKDKDTLALGTPGYAAPEAGSGQTDERSDIYSLCVVLHQLLSLHNPASTIFNPPPLRALNPLVSKEMESIIMRGLQNNRQLRWGSAREMQEALEKKGGGKINPSGGAFVANYIAPTFPAPRVEETQGASEPPGRLSSPEMVAIVEHAAGDSKKSFPPPPISPSRPTTRLLMVATQLSPWQLIGVGSVLLLGIILGTWLLAEPLSRLNLAWNNLAAVVAIFGAAGYATYSHRGVALASHLLFASALIATIWLRVPQGYSWANLLLGALISGIAMELWISLLPWLKRSWRGEAWKIEAGAISTMGMLGTVLLMALATEGVTLEYLGLWLLSPVFGLLGWFSGDMLRQYLLYKKTGIWRA